MLLNIRAHKMLIEEKKKKMKKVQSYSTFRKGNETTIFLNPIRRHAIK